MPKFYIEDTLSADDELEQSKFQAGDFFTDKLPNTFLLTCFAQIEEEELLTNFSETFQIEVQAIKNGAQDDGNIKINQQDQNQTTSFFSQRGLLNDCGEIASENQNSQNSKSQKNKNKDKNTCKKYHGLALKSLKELKLSAKANQYKHKKYRQDFFLILLLIARQYQQLPKFKEIYQRKVTVLRSECIQAIRDSLSGEEVKINIDILNGIQNSFKCIEFFELNEIQQSIKVLFDSYLRNKKLIDLSHKYILLVQQQIKTLSGINKG